MSASPQFSQFDVYIFLFISLCLLAQTVEKNAGLGHAWQKMMCLFTDRRGIDAKARSRLILELLLPVESFDAPWENPPPFTFIIASQLSLSQIIALVCTECIG